jgi:hypothetical protein
VEGTKDVELLISDGNTKKLRVHEAIFNKRKKVSEEWRQKCTKKLSSEEKCQMGKENNDSPVISPVVLDYKHFTKNWTLI